MSDRVGYASRLIWYPEADGFDTDPAAPVGHIVPLGDASGYGDNSDPVTVPIFMGDGLLPYDAIQGLIMAGGNLPCNLEYEFAGHPLRSFFGSDGYAHVAGTKLHQFLIAAVTGAQPGSSFQLQKEWMEGTDKFLRGRGNRLSGISWEGAASGYARWMLEVLGCGDMVQADLAGTKTDNGFAASSYTDGQMKYTADGTTTVITDVSGFRCRFFNNAARREAFYNGGKAGAVNAFKINGEGELAIPMQNGGTGPQGDLNFYNNAVNRTEVDIDVVQANAPLSGGNATKFKRTQLQALLLIRQAPRVGGDGVIEYTQRWILRRSDNAKTAGEYFGETAGPYAVTGGSNDKLGIKVDGGGTQTITLTAGGARTATQIVADINATLTGATADVFLGRYVRIVSATKGSSSSIQIDTGVANTGHALFGFTGTARAGRSNCPLLISLFNARTSDY